VQEDQIVFGNDRWVYSTCFAQQRSAVLWRGIFGRESQLRSLPLIAPNSNTIRDGGEMSTITFRQTAPTAMRLAIILACVAVICALPIYVFGLVNTINAVESFRALFSGVPGGRYVGAAIVVLIFFPPALILVRYSSPKNEVVFGETALTIKARRELKSIAYAEIGSMVLRQFMSRRLELYDNTGLLLHCFETGMDEAVPSLIVRQIADRIAFDARNERRVVRYVRR
jgi:hypothetical protein